MDINNGKTYLIKQNLTEHPTWARNEIDDLIYPVFGLEDFPEDSGNLYIRANFTTPTGLILEGCIIGVKNIFCVAIFWKNKILYLNKNLPNDCLNTIDAISKDIGIKIKSEEFSPLKYETTIDRADFKNISGDFDIFKKRTDQERLS